MKALCSVANEVSNGLNWVVERIRAPRFLSVVNLAFSSSVYEEDDDSGVGEYLSLNNSFLDSGSRPTGQRGQSNNSFPSACSHRQSNYPVPLSRDQRAVDNEMSTIKYILTKQGWNFGLLNGFGVELNEANVIKALNVIFDESGSAAHSLRFFGWLHHKIGLESTIKVFCTMIFILVYGNMNHRVVDLLDDFIQDHPEEDGQEHLILRALEEIPAGRKVRAIVFSMLVKCYVDRDMTTAAVTVVWQMERLGIFPSKGVCNLLIRSLLRSNQEDLVWDLLDLLWSQGMVDASLINPLVSFYFSKDGLHCGWKLLMDMRKFGVKPDVVGYTIVIQSLCKASRLKGATSVVFKMIQTGVHPDLVLLGTLINGYCMVDSPKEALCIAHYFRVSPTIYMYHSFVSLFCKFGDMVQASNIFLEMSESGLNPDCVIYSTLINGYCKVGDTKKALQWLGRMWKCGVKPSVTTFTILIQHYSQSGAMTMAEHVFCYMTDESLVADIVVYNILMNGYGKRGALHKVFQLLGMMRPAGVSPDTVTYNILIHSLISRGFVRKAKDLFDELIHRGFSPDVITFSDLINGFSDRGDFQDAFDLWYTMSKYDTSPDVITCSALLSGYCRACRMDEASAMFDRMLNAGLIPDLILYNTMIRGFCRIGNITHACGLIRMTIEKNLMPNEVTYRALVLGYEKKMVDNASGAALSKLQRILAEYGLLYWG